MRISSTPPYKRSTPDSHAEGAPSYSWFKSQDHSAPFNFTLRGKFREEDRNFQVSMTYEELVELVRNAVQQKAITTEAKAIAESALAALLALLSS